MLIAAAMIAGGCTTTSLNSVASAPEVAASTTSGYEQGVGRIIQTLAVQSGIVHWNLAAVRDFDSQRYYLCAAAKANWLKDDCILFGKQLSERKAARRAVYSKYWMSTNTLIFELRPDELKAIAGGLLTIKGTDGSAQINIPAPFVEGLLKAEVDRLGVFKSQAARLAEIRAEEAAEASAREREDQRKKEARERKNYNRRAKFVNEHPNLPAELKWKIMHGQLAIGMSEAQATAAIGHLSFDYQRTNVNGTTCVYWAAEADLKTTLIFIDGVLCQWTES